MAAMVPILGRDLEPEFNVFDVMHHGLHEKQISNVFGWLLEADGTHGLGDRFIRIFVDAVNAETNPDLPADDRYWVRQEVNTAREDGIVDIADLVVEGDTTVMVVENYFTSDGHGHCYDRYLAYGQRDGKRGSVVLLCRRVQKSLLTNNWDQAAVLTYAQLIDRLWSQVGSDSSYRKQHPEAHSFIEQIHRKFVEGGRTVKQDDVLGFVVAMCDAGEARRYQAQSQAVAADQFATDLAAQARERFGEGRELLMNLKGQLKSFSAEVLKGQLNSTLGEDFVRGVGANLQGIHQWTITFHVPRKESSSDEGRVQLKFGPSAWFANERDEKWRKTVEEAEADYGRIFITSSTSSEIRQSEVTLEEALNGLDPSDTRLHDEIVGLLNAPAAVAG
ncbi:PD-(D/E)XK nuclease family protein [Janibacter cremeus]|uniref:PD-(D/E)XK nuclease superfamily protein n=1 Tax=Janibacter cremeus TaxID=1285192 RepID=A0A852VII3_9MICO|nr:PD-(D/E)XK nuclease family protein [Janibacter cremeus]NYF96907.1 hypothetical protein [Janibacter cremeus]